VDTICAFSSDSRTLYKADIYRVLALPKGHIVHFRYKKKYVDDNLLQSKANLIGKRVAIFFTTGNSNGNTPSQLTNTSIRWGTISHYEISNETDVFHAYLKLGEFCNVAIDSGNSVEKRPPTKFFSQLACTESGEESNWQSRISKVKSFFPNATFLLVKGIYKNDNELPISYQNSNKSCHYNLINGERYILKMALGNPDSSATKIEVSDSSEEITINCINPIETSVQFDDFDVPISVKTIQVMKQASLLTFKPIATKSNNEEKNDFGEYATNIELSLNLSLKQPALFGFFSMIAAASVFLATPVPVTAVRPSICMLIVSALLFWGSTGTLFYWFNKK